MISLRASLFLSTDSESGPKSEFRKSLVQVYTQALYLVQNGLGFGNVKWLGILEVDFDPDLIT